MQPIHPQNLRTGSNYLYPVFPASHKGPRAHELAPGSTALARPTWFRFIRNAAPASVQRSRRVTLLLLSCLYCGVGVVGAASLQAQTISWKEQTASLQNQTASLQNQTASLQNQTALLQTQTASPNAQSLVALNTGTPNLPDAPSTTLLRQTASDPSSSSQTPAAQTTETQTSPTPASAPVGSSLISGSVLDVSGAVVSNASVTLVGADGRDQRVIRSGINGEFLFDSLPAGSYRVTVTSTGLEPYISPQVVLTPGQSIQLPRIALPIATSVTQISVPTNQEELATEQVNLELKQRVFGILPNFYSSYLKDAVPLSAKQKFRLAAYSVFDPTEYIAAGFVSGIQQATNTFPGYNQGLKGFARRYGANFGDQASSRIIGSALLPTILHQDPRYFYQGTGTRAQRAKYAILYAIRTRSDKGKSQFNYSYIGGAFASSAIATTYHPDSSRGARLIFGNAALDVGGHAVSNLLREFVLKGLTPSAPPDPPSTTP